MPDPTEAGSLDLAIDWLQRNLDELTEATRRTQQLSAGPLVRPVGGAPVASSAEPIAAASASPDVSPSRAALPSMAGSPSVPSARATPPTPGASTTPLLDTIGRDLTKLAAEGSLTPLIGRTQEMDWLIEVLVRTTKRNPVLLGPAGAGKTAIVEGLAQRIAAGKVPALLQGTRLIEVPLGGLVAGTQYRGQLEERLAELVKEASQPGVILFFDEIHLLEGAGKSEGGMGADEVLKPALARGDIAVIGATTPEDYRRSIEQDSALARRFTTIDVRELDKAATRPILQAFRDRLATSRGVTVTDDALDVLLDFADASIINRRFPDKAIDLLEQTIAEAIVAGRTTVGHDDAIRTTELWTRRASSTPTLDRFGRDLVGLAGAGKLGPIVGRDREIDAIVDVLLRRTKRNPLLLGAAGTGKTAIVEGLAIRIAAGQVPPALHDVRVFDVQLLSLAGAMSTDPGLLDDFLLEARHPSVVVFFDEIHLLASPAVRDLGQALKPVLARGEIACIGATTGEEYQASLESDAALARRFSIIPIEPMDPAAVHQVLVAVRDSLAKQRGVRVEDDAIDELTALADQFLPNRAFPDKGVDLIEQSVAYATTHGQTTVDVATARDAVAAMTGMPIDPTGPISALAADIDRRGLLEASAADALVGRLRVSLRGLDAQTRWPDAVILLCGSAADAADLLAGAIASSLFGRPGAVIPIDLAGMTEDQSISTLLGSAPGLVGSDRPLPLQELRRSPWQVVLFRGIERCAIPIRETIAAGLMSGNLTDAMGRGLPLGAAVVLLTAATLAVSDGALPGSGTRALIVAELGPDLVAACDVIAGTGPAVAATGRDDWLRSQLLDPLAARFARQGCSVTFDPQFAPWLEAHLPTDGEAPEAFLDRAVTPLLAASLPPGGGSAVATIVDDKPVLKASAG